MSGSGQSLQRVMQVTTVESTILVPIVPIGSLPVLFEQWDIDFEKSGNPQMLRFTASD
jgi:hypothetical protein